MDWQNPAHRLAHQVANSPSRWHESVKQVPRHVFVPRWWDWSGGSYVLRDGPADSDAWLDAAYRDQTLVTRVGPLHADHAEADAAPEGVPTSSSTLPGLVLTMLRLGRLYDGADILDLATGSGYSAGLLAHRFGGDRVTSIDVDPYLAKAAAERLASLGLHPTVTTCDATGELPGTYDRIISMVSVPRIPASWVAALRTGGRLVTTLTDLHVIVTADKLPDGRLRGRVEWERGSFMTTRSGDDYPPRPGPDFAVVSTGDGDTVTTGRYPVVQIHESWELSAVLAIEVPGVWHSFHRTDDGWRTAWITAPDGSWARAQGYKREAPTVHQAGPQRLWDVLDELRESWLTYGYFQLYGAEVTVERDGALTFERGDWAATIG
ncbi:methyltransferase domain-containing protein [Yinghuangia soli]|uniref:Protein-L-isoaspartate O-methyltransferase n=1 Tax=Yinghuangia soli TaxID=2908204 RepID=A0AA41PUZ6_9ACTN|nr:methyltransferase domain-containing protein [Yinghuangia soli]MCF2526339.1 methyltransferase domain-containing protein [Yinghuangia soli]